VINPRPFRIWPSVRPLLYPRWQMCRCHVIALNVRCSTPLFPLPSCQRPWIVPVAYVALIKLVFIMAMAKSPPICHAPRLVWGITRSTSMGITCRQCSERYDDDHDDDDDGNHHNFSAAAVEKHKKRKSTMGLVVKGDFLKKIEIVRRACNWQSTIDSV